MPFHHTYHSPEAHRAAGIARRLAKRLDAALLRTRFPVYVLQSKARQLDCYRRSGDAYSLSRFLAENGELLRGEIASAYRVRKAA